MLWWKVKRINLVDHGLIESITNYLQLRNLAELVRKLSPPAIWFRTRTTVDIGDENLVDVK